MILTSASIEAHLRSLSANGASANTLRAYKADLTGWLNWNEAHGWLDLEHSAAQYLTENRDSWAPRTTLRKLAAIRSFATTNGQPKFLPNYRPPTPSRAMPHPLPEGIDGVMRMIDSTNNPRHKALLALCGLLGLRVDEAVNVESGHFFEDQNGTWLRVRGKGSKDRNVPVSPSVLAILAPAIKLSTVADTTVVKVTNSGARRSVARHGRRAGLSRPAASHDLRATFATAAYKNSLNLRAVQDLLGHASPVTTQVYTGVSPAEMRQAGGVI